MKKMAICFGSHGMEVIKRLNAGAVEHGIEPAEAYIHSAGVKDDPEGFKSYGGSVSEWALTAESKGACAIFVSAVGIAVRACAAISKDKLKDIPVIVIDDNARFVIPILSGHAGGANKIALVLAELLGAVPVITTSTDVNGAFSVDVFAAENRLNIDNRNGIKKLSAKAIEGKPVTISFKHYPPEDGADVIVADETDREYTILLKPKKYVLGIGTKRGKDPAELESFITGILDEKGISYDDIYAVCTIDIKQDEEALRALSQKYRIPLLCFDTLMLSEAKGEFESSDFVSKTVGVDNVCERAACLGAGRGAVKLIGKTKKDGMTAAVYMRSV